MGSAFLPVFDDAKAEWPDDINGKCLARAADLFDKPCKKAGVATLYDFFSMSQDAMIAEILGGDPEDPTSYDASQIPEEKWFDPTSGLATVRFLIEFVVDNPEQFEKLDPEGLPACVLEDLRAFEKHLVQAAERGARWHLEIDY